MGELQFGCDGSQGGGVGWQFGCDGSQDGGVGWQFGCDGSQDGGVGWQTGCDGSQGRLGSGTQHRADALDAKYSFLKSLAPTE